MMSDLVFRKTDEVPKVVNVNEKRVIEVVERFLSQGSPAVLATNVPSISSR